MDQRGRKFTPAHRWADFSENTHPRNFPAPPRRIMILSTIPF
jgi:hypothetical protein